MQARSRPLLTWFVVMAAVLLLSSATAQVTVPTLGTRGQVPGALVDTVTAGLRAALQGAGLEVRPGELITAGIAGSLEPEFTRLIAEVDGSRYAVSGEVAEAGPGAASPYLVNVIAVEADSGRATDLITLPLEPDEGARVGALLAAEIALFARPLGSLDPGSAGLFVSSEPRGAAVTVNGVPVGSTPDVEPLMLAPGRYRLELRIDGFLPETRSVDLREGDTSFVHVVMTMITGGSIRVQSVPEARVLLDGVAVGSTPLTMPAHAGPHVVTLERDGFLPEVVEVPVRTYRVTRVDTELTPARDPLLFWPETRGTLVRIDGRLQPGGWADGLEPGLRRIELIAPTGRTEVLRAVPDTGMFLLDLVTGDLVPFDP